MTIWLVGGTRDSAHFSHRLTAAQLPWVATVTTSDALRLYDPVDRLPPRSLTQNQRLLQIPSAPGKAIACSLSADSIPDFLEQQTITAILDASHPFAAQISQLAIQTAATYALPYLRYERPEVPFSPDTLRFPDFSSLLQSPSLHHRRILLTTGVKTLHLFSPLLSHTQLWARILPAERSLAMAIAAGFPEDRLIQKRPPVPLAEERQLWRKLSIDTVITKSSGAPSGLRLKQTLAQEMGIQLIAVNRPSVQYPAVTTDFSEAISICKTW